MAICFCTNSTSLSTDSNRRSNTSSAIRCDFGSYLPQVIPSSYAKEVCEFVLYTVFCQYSMYPALYHDSILSKLHSQPQHFSQTLEKFDQNASQPPIRARSPLCRVVNRVANQPLGLLRPWGLTAYPPTQQSTNMCFGKVYFSRHQSYHFFIWAKVILM